MSLHTLIKKIYIHDFKNNITLSEVYIAIGLKVNKIKIRTVYKVG